MIIHVFVVFALLCVTRRCFYCLLGIHLGERSKCVGKTSSNMRFPSRFGPPATVVGEALTRATGEGPL